MYLFFSGALRMVTLHLSERDIRNAVLRILKSCDLPTTYVDSINPPPPRTTENFSGLQAKSAAWQKYESMFKDNDDAYGTQVIRSMVRKAKEAESLMYGHPFSCRVYEK